MMTLNVSVQLEYIRQLSYTLGVAYEEYSEANYFADQTGVWEIRQGTQRMKNKVMEQVRET